MDIIDKCFNISEAISNKDITEFKRLDSENNSKIFSFEQNGKNFIFKAAATNNYNVPDLEYCYNEILASYVARYLKIDSISAKLGRYKTKLSKTEIYGNILENYNRNGYRSYLGRYFLEEYFEYLKKNNKLSEYGINQDSNYYGPTRLNNLKCIKEALTLYMKEKKYEDYDEIVDRFMDEFARRFCFDYLTMQADRHPENWAILESVDQRIALSKVFDNELAFQKDFTVELKVNNQNETNEESLNNFLSFSKKYKEMFLDMYNRLTPEEFENIINVMEMQEGVLPSPLYKYNLIENYTKHYENIKNIINKLEVGDSLGR